MHVTTYSRTLSRVVGVFAASAMALGLAACSGGASAPSTPVYKSTYKPPAPTVIAPLTGVTVPAGSATGPSLAVKVCNSYQCSPQISLNDADIVFEELVEGGITRYVAFYQSLVPDVVGPIRSIRPTDPNIVSSFGGIVAYSGGANQGILDMIEATGLVNVTENNPNEYRLTDRYAPYNLVLAAKNVVSENSTLAPPQQQFAYSSSANTSSAFRDGIPTSNIEVTFSYEYDDSWSFDPNSNQYLRSQWGVPDMDANGTQFSANNLIVMLVENSIYSGNVPIANLISTGEAWVSTGGKTIHATWSKSAPTSPIKFTDDYGVTIRLSPGKTWIEMPPPGDGAIVLTQ